VRLLAVALLLLASCQTTRQAKIVTIGATGVALVGGYFEYEARSNGGSFKENIPITFGFAGVIALVSFASIFWLDEIPRIEGSDEWRPSDYRAGTELLAGIQRTTCFGSCPAYTLAVYRDGTVEFEGRAYVNVCGTAIGKIGPDKVIELERKLIDAHVTAMDGAYADYNATDLPSAYLWFRPRGGHTKGIAHYLGDDSAPEALRRAEQAVDTAANVEQWIGDQTARKPFEGQICK
jgi:hypothetical protein